MIFKAEPYQDIMIKHLLDRERALEIVGLGLGKTVSTLAALNELFLDGAIRSALVVAPLRVANMTWPNEVRKWDFSRWMRVESLRGRSPSGKAQLYTINYESLPRLTDLSFCDVAIFDEITRAKNPKSERIKALVPLLKHHRRWGLTGTPRPNSLLELFAQVRLLDDGQRLGKSFHQFQRTWFHPTDYLEYNWEPNPGAEERIYEKIHDLALTLRASDYSDQPDTVVEDVEIALPEQARDMYKELEKELLVACGDEGDVVAQNAAALVNKLLQIAGGTVYNETRGAIQVHDGKIKALKRLLVEIGDENTIIFTNYIHERERVCAAIGGTDAAKFRGDIEDAWNSGSIKHLVADPRSLGHGLNLQKGGRNVVWFSPTWSREYYDQANARVARKGQTEIPRVYRLLCSGTMDDVVVEVLREKDLGQKAMLEILTNFRRQGRTFL